MLLGAIGISVEAFLLFAECHFRITTAAKRNARKKRFHISTATE